MEMYIHGDARGVGCGLGCLVAMLEWSTYCKKQMLQIVAWSCLCLLWAWQSSGAVNP